jgi:hypothetical protein
MRIRTMLTTGVAVAGIAVIPAGPGTARPTGVSAAARHFDATVTAVDRANRRFRARVSRSRSVRFQVTRATRFERVTFRGLHKGSKVEVTARLRSGVWRAVEVEKSGRRGEAEPGDDHGGGNDDGAGHT